MNIAALAGILGGIGQAGGAAASAQDRELKARQVAIEQQRADQLARFEEQRNALLKQQIDAQSPVIAPLVKAGLLPPSMLEGGVERLPTDLLKSAQTAYAEQVALDRAARQQAGTAAFIQQAKGQPAQLLGQLAEGEDPEAAALIPRSANVPAMGAEDLTAGLIGRGTKATDIAALMKILRPEAAAEQNKLIATDKPIYNPATGKWEMPPKVDLPAITPPLNSRPKLSVNEKGEPSTAYENEPWQWEIARGALADKGWRPEMPGYRAAFFDAVSQLTPVTEGGGAATRSQGIPSPTGGQPQQTPTVITGPPRPVSDATARTVAGAEMASQAIQRLLKTARDPEVQAYLGPFDQYRSAAQRKAPNAMLGEVPPAVVDLDQDIATTKNYLINLRSGAAVTVQEADRMEQELMKKSSRGEVFAREVENTARNIAHLEQRVKALALRGDQKALSVAQQYGLLDTPAPAAGRPQIGEPGYTGLIMQPTMPQGSPGPGKVWIMAPDGVWGKWDARQPIPQGYKR